MTNYIEVTSDQGEGALIRSVATGEVADVGYRPGYGDNAVVIKYDDGPFVLYGYNSAARVAPGELVYPNTIIAEMGCEGVCAEKMMGPRVHIKASNTFEGLFEGGDNLLDPELVFEQINKTPPPTAAPYVPSGSAIARIGGGSGQATSVADFINIFKKAVGAPYRWGGGHGDGWGIKEAAEKGADASGIFNIVRREMELVDPEIGSFPEYFNFLANLQTLSAFGIPGTDKKIPIGSVLINPEAGHMAMVHNVDQQLLEANGELGITDSRTFNEANSGWEGFTHIGIMPDVGVYGPPPEREAFGPVGEGPDAKIYTHPVVGQGREAKRAFELTTRVTGDDIVSAAGYLGPTSCDVQDYIRQRANDIKDKCGVSWNTYDGHVYRDGATQDTTVDFWNTGGRGDTITEDQADCVRNQVLNNYCSDAMYMISDGNMYDNPDAGGVYPFPDDPHYDHVHVSWNGNGLGATCKGAGGTGTSKKGSSSGQAQGGANDPEPCIMRNPLGPYKLLQTPGWNYSAMVRSAALHGGDYSKWKDFQKRVMDKEHGEGYDAVKSIIDAQLKAGPGARDWIQLGELKKVPYMGTIKDVAHSGLYSFNSMGTGEVVFWYPDLIMKLKDKTLQTDPLIGMDQAGREQFFNNLPDAGKCAYVVGLSANQIRERFPSLTEDQISALMTCAQSVGQEEQNPYGREFNSNVDTTNVDILNERLILTDTELIDFHLYMSDEELVTHYFVMGDYRLEGRRPVDPITEIKCWMWSDIFHHPYFSAMKESGSFDPDSFIQRYGSRTRKEDVPAIKLPGMAVLWADNMLLKQWFNCYTVQLEIAYMPMLYPGMTIEIQSLGLIVQVLSVNITFGETWSTRVDTAIRGKTKNSTIQHVPFWDIGDEHATQANARGPRTQNPNDPTPLDPFQIPGTSAGSQVPTGNPLSETPDNPSPPRVIPPETPDSTTEHPQTVVPAETPDNTKDIIPRAKSLDELQKDLQNDFQRQTDQADQLRDQWLNQFTDPEQKQALEDALKKYEDQQAALSKETPDQ